VVLLGQDTGGEALKQAYINNHKLFQFNTLKPGSQNPGLPRDSKGCIDNRLRTVMLFLRSEFRI
jgi:hypothetical protein